MIEFDRKELKRALSIVGLGADQKNTIPILECCQIIADEQGCTIRGTNLDFDVTVKVQATFAQPQEIIVTRARLDLICEAAGERVSVEDDGKAIRLHCGKMKLKAERYSPSRYPQVREGALLDAGTIDGLILSDLLATHAGASAVDSRYALHNVLLSKEANKIEAAATNSHQLFLASISNQSLEDFSVLVPAPAASKLRSVLAGHPYRLEVHSAESNQKFIRVTDTETKDVFVINCGSGQFPNYQMVLPPKMPLLHASIEPLRESARLGMNFYSSRKAGNRLDIDSASCRIVARSDNNELEIEAEEIGLLECGLKAFDPAYVGKIFQWMDGEIRIGIYDSMLIAIAETERGVSHQSYLQGMRTE